MIDLAGARCTFGTERSAFAPPFVPTEQRGPLLHGCRDELARPAKSRVFPQIAMTQEPEIAEVAQIGLCESRERRVPGRKRTWAT